MSYIARLLSMTKEAIEAELKSAIERSQKLLMDDPARRKLLDEDQANCWDSIDELIFDGPIQFDDERKECKIEIRWESFGPHDENDERSMCGYATATFDDNSRVSFSNTSVSFDGAAPRPSDWWEDLDEDEREGRIHDMNKD